MNLPNTFLSLLLLVHGPAAAAITDYSTSFTDREAAPFTDGSLTAQNGWFSQGLGAVSDAAGAGLVTLGNTERAIHGPSGGSFEIGESITMTLVMKFSPEVNPNAVWRFGLTETTSVGAGDPRVGAEVRRNRSDIPDQFMQLRDQSGGNTTTSTISSADTGFHTIKTTITKSATQDEFQVTSSFEGTVVSYTVINSQLYGAENVYPVFQQRGGASLGLVDSFSISTSDHPINGDPLAVQDTSYQAGVGVTIRYNSNSAPVDVYRNISGDLGQEDFVLLASGETSGIYLDQSADHTAAPKAFYLIVPAGSPPFRP